MKKIILLGLIALATNVRSQSAWSCTSIGGGCYRNGATGIGTYGTPGKMLDVYAVSDNGIRYAYDGGVLGVNSSFYLKNNFTNKGWNITMDGNSTGNLTFNNNVSAPNIFLHGNSVKVGIGGTTNPTANLHVYAVGSSENGLNIETSSSAGYALAVHNASGGKFAIWNDGRIAVGYTGAPDMAKLNVDIDNSISNAFDVYNSSTGRAEFRVKTNGIVYAREINIISTTFPDYVFAKDYKLMPLTELEIYIKKNNHLPNVPTAEKVISEGMNIGEISRINTEKIEELTLYIIELKKEINELKKQK